MQELLAKDCGQDKEAGDRLPSLDVKGILKASFCEVLWYNCF